MYLELVSVMGRMSCLDGCMVGMKDIWVVGWWNPGCGKGNGEWIRGGWLLLKRSCFAGKQDPYFIVQLGNQHFVSTACIGRVRWGLLGLEYWWKCNENVMAVAHCGVFDCFRLCYVQMVGKTQIGTKDFNFRLQMRTSCSSRWVKMEFVDDISTYSHRVSNDKMPNLCLVNSRLKTRMLWQQMIC